MPYQSQTSRQRHHPGRNGHVFTRFVRLENGCRTRGTRRQLGWQCDWLELGECVLGPWSAMDNCRRVLDDKRVR